ncbi:hypothetical protein [Paracoccus albus]|uniref:hypothetical protein n=1 Tax=Paracoccus albus TaxID=3017784 RepID=UPI003EB6FA76
MAAIEEIPNMDLAELRDRLVEERGERFALSTIHDVFRRHGISFQKRRRMRANRTGKFKALLRKAAARTVEALETATATLLEAFTPDECANYFANSGYEKN